MFLNSEGEEIDRLLGFYPPDQFITQVTKIVQGVDTYLSLKKQYLSGDTSSELLSKLSYKCDNGSHESLCEEVYSTLISNSENIDEKILFKSKLFFANQDLKNNKIISIFDLIEQYQEKEFVIDAYLTIIKYYYSTNQIKEEAASYKELTDKFNTDPSILNRYAWRMSELGLYLDDALNKSSKAIELSEDIELKSMILDTKAEILWTLKRVDEAIIAIDEAISINPDYEYFRNQKEKFLKSND